MSMEPLKELEILEELETSTKYAGRIAIFDQNTDGTYSYSSIDPEVDQKLGQAPSRELINQVSEKYGFLMVIFVDNV